MKMTLDLPNDLVRELKLRAVHGSRKLKDTAAALPAAGIEADAAMSKSASPRKGAIKLPLFRSSKDAPARQLTAAQLIALEKETQTCEDLERLGLPL